MFGYIFLSILKELLGSISGCIASDEGKNEGKTILKE
jgi:hypothetical protein